MAPFQQTLKIGTSDDGHKIVIADIQGKLFLEDGVWISFCQCLDITTCGKTREEAIKNTREAIVLFFESCLRRNTLEKALFELGWKAGSPDQIEDLFSRKECKHATAKVEIPSPTTRGTR